MKRINLDQIKEVLGKNNIEYSCSFNGKSEYTVASLFSPVKNGFYFYNGLGAFDINIERSLILAKKQSTLIDYRCNQFIELPFDEPQEIYYLILNSIFPRLSTGIIRNSSVISKDCLLGDNVQIDDFCVIEDNVIIKDGVTIGSHCKIHSDTIIEENTIIECGSVIGTQGVAWTWNSDQTEKITQPQLGGVIIEKNSFLGAGTIIVRGSLNENTIVGENCLMAPGSRIGHGTIIGKFVHFANNVVTGGNTCIGDYSFIGSAAVFRPKVNVHPKTIIGAGSVIVKNTSKSGLTLMGVPAKEYNTSSSPSGMPKPKNN